MNGWPLVPLGDILTERREQPDLNAVFEGRIRIVAKIVFATGRLELRSEPETNTGMILVRPGDLLISGINASKGAIAMHDQPKAGALAATIHYSAYEPRSDRVRGIYLWWLLRSKLFKRLLADQVPGGIKSELKAKRLLPVRVPLPGLPEQDRLVAELHDHIDEINIVRRLAMNSEAMRSEVLQSAIDSVFGKFDSHEPFANVIVFKPRSGPSFPTDPEWTGTPVLMPSALTGFGVDMSRVECGPGNEAYSEKDRLLPGDILIARGNKAEQVGNAGVVPSEATGWVCANLLMRMQIDTRQVDQDFCIYWLRSSAMRRHVKHKMKGTSPSIQKINQKAILGFPFPANVALARQQELARNLDYLEGNLDRLAEWKANEIPKLDELWDSMVDRLLTGVSDERAQQRC